MPGESLVLWLLENSAVESREEGLQMGERFYQAGVIEGVTNKTNFKDDTNTYYRFVPQVQPRISFASLCIVLRCIVYCAYCVLCIGCCTVSW